MANKNQANHLRREVLIRTIQSFLSDNFDDKVETIPFVMRPKNSKASYRCCIHKERAILRDRAIAALGGSLEQDDDMKSLSSYAREAINRTDISPEVLTILSDACHGCVPSRVFVTDLCQGCVARTCVGSCKFNAITIVNGRSVIDSEKCKNCGLCIKECPYHAIVKRVVPCEDACPVGAIEKGEEGYAEIDFDKCISCGACIVGCPFGAVMEKSQIIDVLKVIKAGKKVVGMLAPSVVGQLPVSINKIAAGLIDAGFSDVYEVAQGADLTSEHESHDFKERMTKGDDFMTTSCCAAYNQLVEKHVTELNDYVSETPTPMWYTADAIKKQDKDNLTVFVGPCVAKRKEGLNDENVDFVLSFEEMGALFVAMHIELADCKDYIFSTKSLASSKRFGYGGGVAQAVIDVSSDREQIKPVLVDGLNKKSVRELKAYAAKKHCPHGNLIEVMACPGGCVGGSSTLNDKKISVKEIKKYSELD